MTHLQAAKWAGYTPAQFDSLDVWQQAEAVAGYLVDGRVEAINAHRARQQTQQATGETFEDDRD